MSAQDRRRYRRADLAAESCSDRLGLARIGNDNEEFARLQELADEHRDRSFRDVVEAREPAFPNLLAAACFVQGDDDVRRRRIEVGGRVVEGEVSIFADTYERHVDGRGGKRFAGTPACLGRIGVYIEEVYGGHTGLVDQ